MNSVKEYCRCCYATNSLQALRGPVLNVFTLICNTEGLEYDLSQITMCRQCCEFLEKVLSFKFECAAVDDIFLKETDGKHHKVKKEAISEYNEIDQIDVRINRVEVDSDLKSSTFPECNRKQSRPVNCSYCNYSARSKQNLTSHIRRCHPDATDRPFKCSECSFRASTFYTMKMHSAIKHSDERPFICDHCNHSAKTKSGLLKHIINIHVKVSKPFECIECSYKTKYKQGLRLHVRRMHSDDKPFSCDQCDYSAKMKINLTIHKRIHLDDIGNPYKCNECSYKTNNTSALKEHIASKHSDDRPFVCEHCNYSAKTKILLTKHKKSHMDVGENLHKCNECSYEGNTAQKLKRHMAHRHSDDRPFSCDLCNYSAKSKQHLSSHKKRLHADDAEKLYKCSECPLETTNVKPFSCDRCNYSTKLKSDLNLHKRVHLDVAENPYKCNECSYKTISMYLLKMHIAQRHSDDRPFGCDRCDYSAKVKPALLRHIRKKHTDNIILNQVE